MRKTNLFVVTKTTKNIFEIKDEGIDRGLIYPAPHILIHKYDPTDPAGAWEHTKMRPLNSPCATVREGISNKMGIGIVIHSPDGIVDQDAIDLSGAIIKMISEDLGMEQYGILTDEVNSTAMVDVLQFHSSVGKAPSIYTKRIQ